MMIVPLPFIVPLLASAGLVIFSSLLPRSFVDLFSIVVAAAVTGLCAMLVVQTARHGTIVYPFGGWQPRGSVVLGILFVIDPLGAGFATLVGTLVTAALVFSWRYFEEVKSLYHVLMLVFLAAMVGFALTGDIFTLFVFFELMSVTAFALTAYKVEEKAPLEGAINFAVTNSVGAFFVLAGIGLLYGRTGALNMAQIGHALSGQAADPLIVTAFILIVGGFFVKAAIVPFHFWMADAHAVAPTPVCVLFSGVMDELAIYAIARVYWTIFVGPFGAQSTSLRAVLVGAGVVTALLGTIMCPLQQHLKRLLAFSTLSHLGLFLLGVALLTPLGLAGSGIYILAHAFIKGALFLMVGILLHHFETVDENRLRGKGRCLPVTGVLWLLGGLALASLPPFGTFLGKGMVEDAASAVGYSWVTVVAVLASISTGGAVLRAGGSVFLGWGHTEEDASAAQSGDERESESGGPSGKTPFVMFLPALVLLVAGFVVGLLPLLSTATEAAAARFQDHQAYVAVVLPAVARPAAPPPLAPAGPTPAMIATGFIAAAGAITFAVLALFAYRLPGAQRRAMGALAAPPIRFLRVLQSGHAGDYVTWIVLGLCLFGGACILALR